MQYKTKKKYYEDVLQISHMFREMQLVKCKYERRKFGTTNYKFLLTIHGSWQETDLLQLVCFIVPYLL
jgi:hypothetical protein